MCQYDDVSCGDSPNKQHHQGTSKDDKHTRNNYSSVKIKLPQNGCLPHNLWHYIEGLFYPSLLIFYPLFLFLHPSKKHIVINETANRPL
jgi:hypothetical protein